MDKQINTETNEFLAELSGYAYLVVYTEEDEEFKKLSLFTDDNCACINISGNEILTKMFADTYGVHTYPALIYRGVLVKDNTSVTSCLDEIDASQMKHTREFLQDFVQPKGLSVIIKGTPEKPYCKYAKQLMKAINSARIQNIKSFNIFDDANLRYYLKKVNNWNTYPMIFLDGIFIGGLDSFLNLLKQGEVNSTSATITDQ